MSLLRRTFLSFAPVLPLVPVIAFRQDSPTGGVPATFPSHDPDVAREMVAVSHGNVARVRELLSNRPALANAAWDWGYGDWESALGAASHVGNREIAGLLLAAGARPSMFSAAMLGQLDTVRAFIVASPGVQKTRGPHGLTLLSHARAGGPAASDVVKYLESVGDADPRYTNEPLTDADRAAIVGTYAFGPGPTERLIVAVGERGATIQREGGTSRGLLHLGARVFHPIGAEAVRVKFPVGERADTVTVEDGGTVVGGRRL